MEELIEFTGTGSSVKEWNARRKEAKEKFSPMLISRLDASGYIKKFLNKK